MVFTIRDFVSLFDDLAVTTLAYILHTGALQQSQLYQEGRRERYPQAVKQSNPFHWPPSKKLCVS